tara:strand:+ start:4964 stop:5287 length:324 start_codon:yes stop_codon:yes gene_type:complete
MSLANTTWNLNDGSGTSATINFGASVTTSGNPAGYGTVTHNYSTGAQVVDITWIEDGNGRFMYQTKGPTENSELPTITGTYNETTAMGWGSNFDAIWGTWSVSMSKQ